MKNVEFTNGIATCPLHEMEQLKVEVSLDAAAFERHYGGHPERVDSGAYPWGWRYAEEVIQASFLDHSLRNVTKV